MRLRTAEELCNFREGQNLSLHESRAGCIKIHLRSTGRPALGDLQHACPEEPFGTRYVFMPPRTQHKLGWASSPMFC